MKKFTESLFFKFGGITGLLYPAAPLAGSLLYFIDKSGWLSLVFLVILGGIYFIVFHLGLFAGILFLAADLFLQPKQININKKRSIVKTMMLYFGFIIYISSIVIIIADDFLLFRHEPRFILLSVLHYIVFAAYNIKGIMLYGLM